MTRETLNQIKEILNAYNEKKGVSVKMRDERKQLIYEAIQKGSYNDLLDFVNDNFDKERGFDSIINKYISQFGVEKEPEQVVDNSQDIITQLKLELAEMKQELVQAQSKSQIGLLEQTLAQVVVQTQGEAIKNEILGDFKKQATDFILENYGPITKKIEVEVGERKTDFGNEVLHEKFDTVLKFVQMNEPVFLTGQAGTGKNVLCKQVAKALGLDFYFTNAVTQEYKLTGFTDANGFYHETQFFQAFKNGGLFMLDEMDASIPEVLVILNAAIANRYFDFPSGKDKDGNEIGGYTEAHPDFRVISAGNTFGLGADYEYVGRNQLDMASLDRFALVEIDYDKNIELNVAEGDQELVDFVEELRTTANQNGIRMIISYRSIGRIARMKKLLDLPEVLKTCLLKNLRKDDINTLTCSMDYNNSYVKCIREKLI